MLKIRQILAAGLASISLSAGAHDICTDIKAPNLLPGSPVQPSDSGQLCSYFDGTAVLVVNTASQCGYTRQFKQLEQLHQRYENRGLRILGFPSDNFGGQEYADAEKTAKVCYRNFGVSFPVFAKSDVKGPNANPLFQRLTDVAGAPAWNFHKYLITAEGIQAFRSSVKPLDAAITKLIERSLATPAQP